MKSETKSWLLAFLAGFLATVLGIVLTFGIEGRISSVKRVKTARLLAEQIVEKMEQTYQELHEYQEIYSSIDSASTCLHLAILADTLDRVDESIVNSFLVNSLSEYVQSDVDNGLDAYISEILTTIGDVALIGHIDRFYSVARQCVKVSQQVIDQKRVVTDNVYTKFYGSDNSVTNPDYVVYLLQLPEYNVFYSRMQNARYPLTEGEKIMQDELDACKAILNIK